jgi:hypothetical protein
VSSAKRISEAGGASLSSEQASTLGGVLSSAASLQNPIFTLIFGRVVEVVGALMRGEEALGSELAGRYGLRAFEPQLKTVGSGLKRLLEHNVAVAGDMYSRVIREKAQGTAASD